MKSLNVLQDEARAQWNDPHKLLSILDLVSDRTGDDVVALRNELIGRLLEIIEPTFPFPRHNRPTADGTLAPDEWPEMGLLRVLDYQVGQKQGVPYPKRKQLLKRAYEWSAEKHLPAHEAADWGEPETRQRMQKIVKSLTAFIDLAKRRETSDMGIAIHHWKRDLGYLKEKFAATYPGLSWPDFSAD